MPVTPLVLVVYALAATRVVGLVVSDALTEPAREGFITWLDGVRERAAAWFDDRPRTAGRYAAAAIAGICWFVEQVITCPWCAGVWVSGAVAPLIWWRGDNPWLLIPALAFALAQFVGMTSHIGR